MFVGITRVTVMAKEAISSGFVGGVTDIASLFARFLDYTDSHYQSYLLNVPLP
jgi:hypothetical protein